MNLHRFDRPYVERHGLVAGVDEVGRGPLAGPVVAAAVLFPVVLIKVRGLNDSKKLSAAERNRLYPLIQKRALAIGIGIVESDQIDSLNIFQATVLAMSRAIDALQVRPAFALIDGRSLKKLAFPHLGVIGGDGRSACIAAASIIAKVTRDRMMETLDHTYPGYEFHRHKGYGTRVHLERLKVLGPCPIHRRSFAPVAALITSRPSI